MVSHVICEAKPGFEARGTFITGGPLILGSVCELCLISHTWGYQRLDQIDGRQRLSPLKGFILETCLAIGDTRFKHD